MLGIDLSLGLYYISVSGILVSNMLVWEGIWERWIAVVSGLGFFYFLCRGGSLIPYVVLRNTTREMMRFRSSCIYTFLLFLAYHLSFEIVPPVLLCLTSKVII